MDGHEITEIKLSELERTKRIDAEFYKKENLAVDATLATWTKTSITDSFNVSDGNHMGISDSFCDEGIPYYRGQDIYHLFIETASPLMINQATYDKPQMRRSHLRKGDILMSIVGAIVGNSAMVTSSAPATCSCKLSIMRTKNKDITPELLLVYIKTRYGQVQIQKFKRGAAQTGLLLEDFDQLYIPVFGEQFQHHIVKTVGYIYECHQKSIEAYEKAQQMLYNMLTITATPQFNTISVKTFEQSFKTTGRLDAEYYQPKYDYYHSKIVDYPNGHFRIGDIAEYIFTGEYSDEYLPKANGRKFYIRGTNMNNGRIETDESYYVNPSKHQKHVSAGDIVTTRVGTVGLFAEIDNSLDGAICSDNVICFRLPDYCKPDVYTLLLNSKPIHELIDRLARGSVQQRLNQETLREVVLPILETELQKNLSDAIQVSISYRAKANILLDYAKQAVEMAIEHGEDSALAWLKDRVSQLEV